MKKVYLIAVVFALVAGFATYMFASQIAKKSTIKDADTVPVVIALQDIPKNTIIKAEMLSEDAGYFRIKNDVVAADATPAAISDLNSLVDKVSKVDIYAGEQMNDYKFVGIDSEDVGISYKLKNGMKAFSFTASSTNGVDGYISPGDTVDIITYETDENGKSSAKVSYRNLRILRVSNASAQNGDERIKSYSTLTVEVTEKQAQQLYLIEKEKTYKLILNSRRDDQNATQEGEVASQTAEQTSEQASQTPQN